MKFTTLAVIAASALGANAWYNATTVTYPAGPTGTGYFPSGTGSPPPYIPSGSGGLSPTKTPVGPSSTTSPGGPEFTGAASSNVASSFSGLAAVGMVVAYFI